MRLTAMSCMALALSVSSQAITYQGGDVCQSNDPYKRKTRSKGEKARNRKNRR